MMHGFLNVFGAAFLAYGGAVSEAHLASCLVETDPAAYDFGGDFFQWRNERVGSSKIREIREKFLPGFGSCSFDEPREDLQNLGFLEP